MGEPLRLRDSALDWRLVEGEVVALDRDRSEYLALNASGATLWNLLAEGSTRQELAESLVTTHGISLEQAQADVRTFVAELTERGLLAS